MYKNTKIPSIEQDKIHNFWHLVKITRNSRKQENMAPNEERGEKKKKTSIETELGMTQMITKTLKQLL